LNILTKIDTRGLFFGNFFLNDLIVAAEASPGAYRGTFYDRLQPQKLVLFNYTRLQQTSDANPDTRVGGPGNILALMLLFNDHSLGAA
jgi:hypothetical protein